jgi:elongation factor 3
MNSLEQMMQALRVSGTTGGVVSAVNADWKTLPSLIPELIKSIKKTGKDDINEVLSSLSGFSALATESMLVAEPFLCNVFPDIINLCSSKSVDVRKTSEKVITEILSNMSSNATREVLEHLFVASRVEQPWQVRAASLRALALLGDVAPEQLGNSLPDVVPQVTDHMTETKKEVSEAARMAMTAACDVIGNRDIEHMTSHIVRSFTHPADVPEIMHKLAGVTFVQSVQSPALAMVVPLLIKGLKVNKTATRRQSCVITDNMSKLVDDPLDAAPFLPTLLPALERAADAMSDPEARGVAENAVKQLKRLQAEAEGFKGDPRAPDETKVLELVTKAIPAVAKVKGSDVPLSHIRNLCTSLMLLKQFNMEQWSEVTNSLAAFSGNKAAAEKAVQSMIPICKDMVKVVIAADDDEDDSEELCNCQFTLAYGTKILLHNTTMRLKRGHKYGLLGGNDSGKTTLMRSIANGSVEGFPDPATVRTVFVEADILGELSHLSCVDYIMQDDRLKHISREEILAVMATVGFTDDGKAKPLHAVSTLSGGWRMKLAMARAMLQRADILLLDEPTNHLDVINVAWVKNYINSLDNVTAIMVSHDKGFLNDCCTDILQINRLKLKQFRGNLDSFMELVPDAKAYFSIKESKLSFKFPQPGPIEGVKSKSKALMKMSKCDFTYPGNTKPTLFDITIQVSMRSRVGCVGENGAGKSTMIKVLTGEVVPQTGDVWKHPNARVAYVAQHAFHHIENHLNKTPNEYIRWRYANGDDKESLVKVSMVLTAEEEKLQKENFDVLWKDEDGKQRKTVRVVMELNGSRRENRQTKEYEYECKFKGGEEGYLGHKLLVRRGWSKSCHAIDARIAQRAGLFIRTLSSANVESHLGDCGLEPEFATHYRMSALSGGQKVKVVLAAAMWNQPHIIILDEPTNYLDRESLGALAKAIEAYEGGVVIISHNSEFVSQVCPEEWVMDAGHLTTKGEVGWMDRQDDKIDDVIKETTMTDALGNTTEIEVKKKLSKREEKQLLKVVKAKIKAGDELDDDEHEFATSNNLL